MSYDKLVKGATKTKHAAPKEKYISGLVTATHESEYACSDIAQAIAPRLRDSNSTVVFKALIITHLILRSGNIKNVYSTWSAKPHLLGLNSVTSGHDTAQNLNNYAFYQHTRLKTYASLGRDAIRDRAERRAEGRGDGGEKLRSLTVEKGLLREVAGLQKLMDTLLDCKFYLEDREDEVTMSALRLLVKDLLTLFTSVNEGVINVLEHYFEMSHSDATTSLKIYKHFCKETEKVVTYLGIAKKMQNVLNVQVPNLKHAPVSLAGSLEEYLKDANFEANRLEYKQNREIAEGKKPSNPVKKPSDSSTPGPSTPKSNEASDAASTSAKPATDNNKAFVDFFESIEQEQTSMFDPQTGSPSQTYFQQQAAFNPFLNQGQMPPSFGQQLAPQMTGAFAFGQHQPRMQMPQMTGMPAFGAFGMSPFGQQQPQMMQPQPTGFLQPQATGINPFRQSMIAPQMTGNPFGQQQQHQGPTSAGAFSPPQQPQQQASSIPAVPQLQPQWTGMNAFQRPASAAANAGNLSSPSRQTASGSTSNSNQPSFADAFGQQNQQPQSQQQTQQQKAPHPLAPQQTGSKNPFAPAPGSSPPPVPQAPLPSMNQLAFNAFQNFQNAQQQQQQSQQQPPQQSQQNNLAQQNQSNGFGAGSAFGDMFGSSSTQPQQQQQAKPQSSQPTGLMGNLASDFAFGRALSPSNTNTNGNNASGAGPGMPTNTSGNLPSFTGTSTASNSTSTPSFGFSSASSATGNTSQNTGSSFTPSSVFGQQFQNGGQGQGQAPIQPQPTGFGGSSIKPFQPTSSFGASLYADQASKGATSPSPAPAMPNQQQQPQQSSFGQNNNNNFFGAFGQDQQQQQQQNGSVNSNNGQNSLGAAATPNPFRMSAMPGNQTGAGGQNAFGGSSNNNFFAGGQSQQGSTAANNNPSPWGSLI